MGITYDQIGNPLNDGEWTYTWQNGRQLASMTNGETTASFVYNENGLRVQKTVNGVVTNYTLHGKNVVHLTRGNDELHFFYDASNKPAVVVYNGVPYSYMKNLQGDVVAILDANGTVVVRYVYDAWGRPISKTGTLVSTLGTVQPFRYRGYVYDEETGLYYLRSRYYRARLNRFINADTYTCTGTQPLNANMFNYCGHDPVNTIDSTGKYKTRIITSVETHIVEDSTEKVYYATTIKYYWADSNDLYSVFGTPEFAETFEYHITNSGIISFSNSQPDAIELLDPLMSLTLASEMQTHAHTQVPGSLEGRTVTGMAFELFAHLGGSLAGIKLGNTGTTEMGSNQKESIGYDYNADWFEHPVRNLGTILNALMN